MAMDMSSEDTVESTGLKKPKGTGREKHNAYILSAAFTAVFTAYLAIQNLQSSLNQEEHLGIISLSSMYACIILSGILAPAILGLVDEKKIIVFSFFCHVLYTGTNFYPTFATLIPSSVLLGLTAGPMWTSQSVYLSDMAYSHAARYDKDGHMILSKFNGIFFSMFETTQITGNLISSLVLQQGSYNETSSANETKFCGRLDCPTATGNSTTAIEEPDMHIVYILLGVFVVCDVLGLLLALCFLPSLDKKRQNFKVVRSVIACGKGLTDINLAMLVPLIMFMAMEQAILWTDYTKVPSSIQIHTQVLYLSASYLILHFVKRDYFLIEDQLKFVGPLNKEILANNRVVNKSVRIEH